MKESPTLKILIAYHKKDKLFKNNFIVPIHLGRAVAKENSKDGKMSKKDLKWLTKNMIGDNTGDNISHLNRCFNEMTAIYWAWKNYDKLGNPDYIGFMHYRRLFDFSEFFSPSGTSTLKKICLEEKNILQILQKYNLIFHRKFLFSPKLDKGRIGFEYYQKDIRLSPKYYPTLYKKYKLFKSDMAFSHYNMFIMRRQDFFQYCETIFDILFTVYNKFIKSAGSPTIPRYVGFASEYLTSFYLDTLKEKDDINALGVRIRFLYKKIPYNWQLFKLWFKTKILRKQKYFKAYRAMYIHKHMNFR